MAVVKVGIVGSRSITDKEYVFSVLNFYLARLLEENEVVVVSGGAIGIDSLAENFAAEKFLKQKFTYLIGKHTEKRQDF